MLTLLIGNKNYSSWSLRPWLVLSVFEIPFQERLIPLYESDSAAQIRSVSPSGKVPCLIDGEQVVWDSLAICEYLAEHYPNKGLWPIHPAKRARARSLAAEMHSGFAALRNECPMNIRRQKPEHVLSAAAASDVDRIITLWQEERARQHNAGPFLFGEFCIADAMFAPVVWRMRSYGIALNGEAAAYADALYRLPAMQDWRTAALAEPWRIAASEV